jgi:hypothetical protein
MGPRASLALALLLAAAALAFQSQRSALPYVRYDRFDLPAFDPYVYMAMADRPTVFTVAPWGYRVLTPLVARALPVGNVAQGFRAVTLAALLAAAGLLWALLRRTGSGGAAAVIGPALLCLSGPVAEALSLRMLAEPLTLALETAFLLFLFAGAGAGPLALVAVLGALGKEFFLLLLPLVYLVRAPRAGRAAALRLMLVVAAPAALATLLLRWWWTPHLASPPPALAQGLPRLLASAHEWAPATLLCGLTVLAVAGAFRAAARPLRAPAAWLAAVSLLPPFVNPVAFFPPDIPRLLIYVLPLAVPLALLAVQRLLPALSPPGGAPPARPTPPSLNAACAAAAALVALAPLLFDRYRRADLRGPRDGPLVVATTRETWRTAGRLERGQAVSFTPESHRFVWGVSDPGQLRAMRWFLREGWGPLPQYGSGDFVMQAGRATLLLPCLRPSDLDLELDLSSPVAVSVNGTAVGEAGAGRARLRLPGHLLFRGDNVLALERPAGGPAVALTRLALAPAP